MPELSSEPLSIVAGTTVSWRKALIDYPASEGWQLSYALVSAASLISITAAAAGNDHVITLPAADTANYIPGNYAWQLFAAQGDERRLVASGRLTIQPDFAAQASGLDSRPHYQIVLDAIEAAIASRASDTELEITLMSGKQIKYASMGELIAARNFYLNEKSQAEAAERIAAGLKPGNKILVRFTR